MSRQHIDRDKTTPRSASDAFDLGPETSEVEGLSIEALELSPTEPTHEQILEWAGVDGVVVDEEAITTYIIYDTEEGSECDIDIMRWYAYWTWEPPKLYYRAISPNDTDPRVLIPRAMTPRELLFGYDIHQHPEVMDLYRNPKVLGLSVDQYGRPIRHPINTELRNYDYLAGDPRFQRGKSELASPLFGAVDDMALEQLQEEYETYVDAGIQRNREAIDRFLRSVAPIYPILLPSERLAVDMLKRDYVAQKAVLPESTQQIINAIAARYAQYCELSRLAELGEIKMHEALYQRSGTDPDPNHIPVWTWVVDADGRIIAPDEEDGESRWWRVGSKDVIVELNNHTASSKYSHQPPMKGNNVTEAQIATVESVCQEYGLAENAWGLDVEEAERQMLLVRYILSKASGFGLGRERLAPRETLEKLFSQYGLVLHAPDAARLYGSDEPLGTMEEPYMNMRSSDVLAEIELHFTDAPDDVLYVTTGRYYGMDWLIAKVCPRMVRDEYGRYCIAQDNEDFVEDSSQKNEEQDMEEKL